MASEPPSTDNAAGKPSLLSDIIALGGAWGSHVVKELQLSPKLVATNAASALLWRRIAAAVIDGIVLFCFFSAANHLRLADMNLMIVLDWNPLAAGKFWLDTLSPLNALCNLKPLYVIMTTDASVLDHRTQFMMFISPFFEMFVIWLYHTVMESSKWQATLGKKICGVVVTDTEGKRISFHRASLRTFAKSIAFIPYILARLVTDLSPLPKFGELLEIPSMFGFAAVLASARQQCLHDAVAGTLVEPAPSVAKTTPAPRAVAVEQERTLIDPERTKEAAAKMEATLIDPERNKEAVAKMESTFVDPNRNPERMAPLEKTLIDPEAPPPNQDEMKECPACAEWIKAKAKKCRYCQERFE